MYISFCFISFQSKEKPPTQRGCLLSVDILISSKGASVLGNKFPNFNWTSNVPFTNNIFKWMNGREIFRQMIAKQTNAQRQTRQPSKQMVERTYMHTYILYLFIHGKTLS